MAKKVLSKEISIDLAYGGSNEYPHLRVVEDKIVDHRRWSVDHEIVVHDLSCDSFYRTRYSVAATESQDESPFQWDDEEIAWDIVVPVEKTVIVYEEAHDVK